MRFKYYILCVVSFIVSSCANYKSVPYFQNVEEFDGSQGASHFDIRVKPKDQLSIFVFSGSDPMAVQLFNMPDHRIVNNQRGAGELNSISSPHHYLVDNEGCIIFPILGTIRLGGLTLEQSNEYIRKKITPFLQPNTDCVVNTYLENFEVTVLGEVNNPNTFTVTRPKISVLEHWRWLVI